MGKYRAYSEYQDSGTDWLGAVPTEWDVQRIKFVADLINEKIASIEGDRYIGLENVSSGTGRYLPSSKPQSPEGVSNRYYPNTILFGKLRPYLAKSLRVYNAGICSSEFLVLRPRIATSRFLHYYTLTDEFVKQVDSSTYGSKMPRANWEFVGSLPMPLPSMKEQDNIADFLDHETARIDRLITRLERLIELLKEKRQAVISHAATKGLNPDAPMKDSGVEWLGKVPAHWECVTLKRLVSTPIIDGPHETPTKQNDGVSFVSAEAISKGVVDFDRKWGFISNEDQERFSKRYSPRILDILVIKLGATTGVCAIVETDKEFNIWVPLAAIRCNELALPHFVLSVLRSSNFQDAIRLSWTYGTQQTLGLKTLENLYIPTPPKGEQQEIVDYLEHFVPRIEKLLLKSDTNIELLKEHRTALISAAVTGKIDVRGWQKPDTEPEETAAAVSA